MSMRSIWVAGNNVLEAACNLVVAVKDFFVALWQALVEELQKVYYRWMEEALPWLSERFEQFKLELWVRLDKVGVPLKKATKALWRELRKSLLKQTLDVFQLEEGSWAYKIVSYLQPPDEETYTIQRTDTVKIHSWDNLPPDVREELIRRKEVSQIDVTRTRDEELEQMELVE